MSVGCSALGADAAQPFGQPTRRSQRHHAGLQCRLQESANTRAETRGNRRAKLIALTYADSNYEKDALAE